MTDKLSTYRKKRDARRTPEPVPPAEQVVPAGNDDTFVVQEHHARRLHWDFRLERGGVLVSWALPKGVPEDPATNHLAVHTEDHPLGYATFAGEIPQGEYGGGRVTIWDSGTYECEKWTDREVKVVLHGRRVTGRYALFQTRGEDWMIHRMDPPVDPAAEPLPDLVRPMLATAGPLPRPEDEAGWAFEMKWDGVRAIGYADRGSWRVMSRNDRDITASYPELRGLTDALGEHRVALDGELVAFDEQGRPSFSVLQQRMHVQRPTPTLRGQVPVTYLVFDLLHLDGHPTTRLPYAERRRLLEGLGLAGDSWQVPPHFEGSGSDALHASEGAGLEGVVAKRLTSTYHPGARSTDWVKVKHVRMQEVVVGGWRPGAGNREGRIGSLLLGVPDPEDRGLRYAGHVGTGFTAAVLDDLARRLRPLERRTSPFAEELPRRDARDARWVTPRLVGEVAYGEWTPDGRLRHPSWRGLRPDKAVAEVRDEPSPGP